jgi:hypothetical protein
MNRVFFAAVCGALAVGSVAATAANYRVAGTIVVEGGAHLVVVEGEDGLQRLLRPGDNLGEGRILSINESYLRLGDGKREWIISLTSGKSTLALPPDAPLVTNLELSPDLQAALENLVATGSPSIVRDQLAAVFGLSAGTWVRAVNETVVATPGAAVKAIQQGLKEGRILHLFLEGSSRSEEIYLLPPTSQ